LASLSQEVHEVERSLPQISNPKSARQGSGVKKNAAAPWEVHLIAFIEQPDNLQAPDRRGSDAHSCLRYYR